MTGITGKTLGNQYFIRSLIGSGATADVYLAWDSIRATEMALKVLRKDLSQEPQFFKLFAAEAKYYRELEHPGIVRLYEFNKDGEYTYIVMDYIEGDNLHHLIQKKGKPLSNGEISHILSVVCSALHYAHQKQIFHCDIKPANILIHSDGRVKLTDFGVAQIARRPGMAGTPPYMAPEQFYGGQIDARTDTYALGISLYEMLSGGQVPYKGTSQFVQGTTLRDRIAWEHLNLELPSIRKFAPGIKPGVESVLIKSMAKDPRARYQSAVELFSAFNISHSDRTSWRTEIDPGSSKGNQSRSTFMQDRIKKIRSTVHNPQLFVRQGEMVNQSINIPPTGFTIGRSKKCQLQITEPSVSRYHATIFPANQGFYIRDEGSSLGTYVNGAPIAEPHRLEHGDMIGIGYVQLFEYQTK
ncbi:protein kinase [Chloroflexota bacterium]